MNRNKIFIITGALFFAFFIALLYWLENMEGQPNDLQNSYQIEIFNCSSIAQNKTDVMNELNAALRSTGSDKDGVQICHIPVLLINDTSFGIPIYGMNNFRLSINRDLYLYKNRKRDETKFFEVADKNEKYLELQKIASKGWFKNEAKLILDWTNNRNEFIISPSQKEKHSKNKKVWKSFLGLRGHIDSLIKIDKSEKNIKVYYFCGSIIDPMLDDDGDGIINSKDSCPQEKGSIERNGCPPCSDGDKDGICDTVDKCPNVRGVKACDGCVCPPPIDNDYDKDGIPNSEDACIRDFGFRRYKGCPIPDTDRDGVNDEIDKCDDLKGTIACKGCTDKDGDGVCDEIDGCIDIRGLIENNGCPKILITLDGTKFKIDGDFDKSKGYTAKLFVNNTKGIVKKFDFQDSKCPSNSAESHAFANQLEAFDLKVTIIVYYKGIKAHEQIFPKMKYVCIKGQDCGFKNM